MSFRKKNFFCFLAASSPSRLLLFVFVTLMKIFPILKNFHQRKFLWWKLFIHSFQFKFKIKVTKTDCSWFNCFSSFYNYENIANTYLPNCNYQPKSIKWEKLELDKDNSSFYSSKFFKLAALSQTGFWIFTLVSSTFYQGEKSESRRKNSSNYRRHQLTK